jgi:hypothetical protein
MAKSSRSQRPERAFSGFVRTDLASQAMASTNFLEAKCRNITYSGREHEIANETVCITSVRQKSQVTNIQPRADDPWYTPEENNGEPNCGDENPRPIRLKHARGFLFHDEAQKAKQRTACREGDKNDKEIIAKNRIVQRNLRRHQRVSCNSAVMRFKRTTIVSTQPATTKKHVQSKIVKRAIDRDPTKNVSHAPQ